MDHRRRDAFAVSANYFETRFNDRIARPVSENLAGVLTDPTLTPFVTLVNPGASAADLALVQDYLSRPEFISSTNYPATSYAAIVDARWVNTGAVRVRGLDFSARYPITVGEVRVAMDASASYILDYETQSTPTSEVRAVDGPVSYTHLTLPTKRIV